jgi:hypothetical protein
MENELFVASVLWHTELRSQTDTWLGSKFLEHV